MALNLSTPWSKFRWTMLYLPLLVLFSSPAVGSDFPSGCTDATACNYNPAATEDDGSCDYCSCVEPSYSLTIEEYAVDIVDGYTTYRFYLNMVNDDDFLSSVFGNSEYPMNLNFSEGFYNSQFGSAVASGINPVFIALIPELAADSWITIGIDSQPEGGEVSISTVEDNNQPFVNHFSFGTPQDGQNVVINSALGGAWYVLNNTPNGLPDDFGRVLAMQVSTTAEFWGNMNFQIYQNGDGSHTINSSIEFDGTGTFYPAGVNPGPSCGCTDSSACNFDDGAAYDDGSCIYSIPETACDCEGTMPDEGYNCDGTCTSDSDGDGICDLFEGCTDEASVNYDPTAVDDDGSCIPFTYGLTLQGILDLTVPEGGVAGKAIHLRSSQAIPDLSYFGVGIANNGGGSDGIEYTFPAQDIPAGVDILVVQNEAAMANYFGACYSGFDYVFVDGSGTINHNGDDAIELFEGGILIETFGDVNVDGTGQPWEYTDSWAFKVDEAWTYGGVNCTDGSTTTQTSNCVYPHCQNLVSVEFEIDLNGTPYPNEEFDQVMINGNWNGWEAFGLLLSDSDGNGIWTGSMSFEDGQYVEFVIALSGPADNSGWGLVYHAPEACASFYDGPTNSLYGFTAAPNTSVSYCAGTCLPAGSCDAYEAITFQVDLSETEVSGDVTLFAEFNEWAYPGTVMSDANGDGIYSITVEGVTPGDWLYRFGIDGELETLNPEAPCVGWIDEYYVQRSMTYAGGYLELPPVCWESCDPCESMGLGCTDPNANNYEPLANADDGSCQYNVLGCTDPTACNYGVLAPCEYASCTCEDLTSISFGGDAYPVEEFAGRCWFKSNLKSQLYADGSPIAYATNAQEWSDASNTFSPIMCAPLDDESLISDYGALYGYYTVEDERGLCPSGWHVASDDDWKALESFLGMADSDLHSLGNRTSGSVGQKLKASPSDAPAWDGLNLFGFHAVPTGMRSPNGSFESQWAHGSFASYWTSTTEPGGARFYRDLLNGQNGIPRWSDGSNYGTTIRCVKGISGCTNPDDSAFNPEAHYDDGSCQDYLGCTDVSACNFDPAATVDDGSCIEAGECGCDFTDADGDGLVDCIDPCTDPNSCNFESGNLDEEGCDYSCTCQDEAACNYGEPVGVGTLWLLVECWEFNFEAYNYPMWYVEGEDSEGYIDSWVGHAPDMFFNEGFGLDACWTIQSMDIPSFFEGELWITLMDTENGTPYFQDTILLNQNLPFDIEICASDYVNDGCTYPLDNLDCSGECINDADGDSVCDEFEIPGCQDEAACNFNPQATEEDFSCLYPEEFYDCEGMCLNDYNADGICDELEVTTCEDELACNYGTPIATASEIQVIIFGINSNFLVDNSWTVEFDGEIYDSGFPGEVSFVTTAVDSCMDISFNLDLAFFEGTFDVILLGEGALGVEFYLEESFDISGLTTHTICISDYLTECEFPEFALNCEGTCMSDIDDDGICDEFEIAGCTEAAACNYNPEATDEDGSCTYPAPGYNCDGSCDDSDGDGVCDSEEVVGCTIASACNFNPLATQENGTCYFADEFEDCDGNCLWESVATGACGELAGLACDGYTFGISPASGGCSSHKTGYFVDEGAVGTAFWQSEYDVAAIEEAASVFVEPNDGQLAWINADGLTGGLGSCNELIVPQVSNALKVDMEGNHGVILRNNGTVASFAPSSAYDALEQTPIIFNYFVLDACAGADFNLAVDGSQNILYWGIPNFALQNDYMEVPHAGGFVQVSAYGHAAAAITEYGELVVWGDESGIVDNAPNAVSDAVSVALGDGFGIVLHEDGDVTQWGTNDAMPAPPTGLGNIIELTASKDQVLAQASDGTFVSWGVNTIPDDPTPYTPLSNISVDIEFCIPGCTSPDYHNYDPAATIDDGSCNNIGCTVAEALNFEPWATDDDGSCIILGCTDPQACNFNPEAQYGIRLDEIAVHDGTVGTSDLSGYTTYHVVLTGPNPSDRLSAVMGDANTPLSWQITDGDIWNELLIGDVVPNINTAFIGFIPELAYDSWVTIGVDPYSYNQSEAVMVVESSEQPWIDEFEAGNGIEMSDGYGGAWFVAGAQTTGLFGEDQEVLLAQVTTNGQFYMASMNIQILPASLGTDDVQLFYEHDLHACSYPDDLLDCDGTCINDADEDGVCDENEVPGCTNAAACNYSNEATDDDGSCIVFEEAIELSVETVVNHTGPGSLNGRSTHRLYANMHNADERVSAVIGFEEHPLLIEQGNGLMYQDVLGGPTPAPLTPAVLSLYPDAAFDSYVALGRGHEDLPTAVQILSGEENWDEFFEIGLPIEISSVVGGGWYSTDVNDGLPEGEDHRVLLGQFTTFGGIQGQVSIQYFDCNGNEVVVHDLLFASENNTAGCMDMAACNYNSEATIDDGTCCFASCATISGFDAVVLSDLIDENPVTLTSTSEVNETQLFEYCLAPSCYLVSGTNPTAISASWNGIDVSDDVIQFGVLGDPDSPCVGCTDNGACNYEASTIFNDESCEFLAGDFNGDLASTVEDMLLLLAEFNNCELPDECQTDIDDSGFVSVEDLLLFLSYFGSSCGE